MQYSMLCSASLDSCFPMFRPGPYLFYEHMETFLLSYAYISIITIEMFHVDASAANNLVYALVCVPAHHFWLQFARTIHQI